MTYYSQRKSILSGEPQSAVNKYGDRRQMERHQYYINRCIQRRENINPE